MTWQIRDLNELITRPRGVESRFADDRLACSRFRSLFFSRQSLCCSAFSSSDRLPCHTRL